MEKLIIQADNYNNSNKQKELPAFLRMYEVSGYGEIGEHAYNRYLASKQSNQKSVDETVEAIDAYRRKFEIADEQGKIDLIKDGLRHGNEDEQFICAKMINKVDDDSRAELIDIGLKSKSENVLREIAMRICVANPAEIPRLFRQVLALPPSDAWNPFNEIWNSLSDEQRKELSKVVSERLENLFKTGSTKEQEAGWRLLGFLEKDERERWLDMILETGDIRVKRLFLRLADDHTDSQMKILIELLEAGLATGDKDCIGLIEAVPEDKRAHYLERGLCMSDMAAQKECALLIATVSDPMEKKELFALALEKLGDHIVEPLMYGYDDLSNDKYARQGFDKTGSGTTLLGKGLKFNSIIRHIKPRAFAAWQKIYEDYGMWQRAGFDYVPVEPIQSFRMNRHGDVDVSSGMLDLDLFSWRSMNGKFDEELSAEKERILETLDKIDFVHGHPHPKNFCLRFFRDESGKVDFERKPRIYLIDYDQAESS